MAKAIADVLNEAAEIVARGWCQGSYAMTLRGERVGAFHSLACRCCADGALKRASGSSATGGARNYVARAAGLRNGDAVFEWNDYPNRTQADVVAALRQAADLAAKEHA